MSKYDKDDFEDEWNEYDIEEYLEERMEHYLERLESDVYHDYYESDEYQKTLIATLGMIRITSCSRLTCTALRALPKI